MFYVGGSSILEVWEGPGTIKFRCVFREGSKVRPWEALFQIFVIFGCKTEASKMTKLMEEFRVRGDRQKSVAYGAQGAQK